MLGNFYLQSQSKPAHYGPQQPPRGKLHWTHQRCTSSFRLRLRMSRARDWKSVQLEQETNSLYSPWCHLLPQQAPWNHQPEGADEPLFQGNGWFLFVENWGWPIEPVNEHFTNKKKHGLPSNFPCKTGTLIQDWHADGFQISPKGGSPS